jgi:hypothetical protein
MIKNKSSKKVFELLVLRNISGLIEVYLMIHYIVAATNNTCMKKIIISKKERIISITPVGFNKLPGKSPALIFVRSTVWCSSQMRGSDGPQIQTRTPYAKKSSA